MVRGKGLFSRIKDRLFGRRCRLVKIELCPAHAQMLEFLAGSATAFNNPSLPSVQELCQNMDTSIENLTALMLPILGTNEKWCKDVTYEMRDQNVKSLLRAFLSEDYDVAAFRTKEKRVRTFHYARLVEKSAMDEAVSLAHYEGLIREKHREIDDGMRAKGAQEAEERKAKAAAEAAAFDALLMADTSVENLASKVHAFRTPMAEWRNDVSRELRDNNVKAMLRAFLLDYGVAAFALPEKRVRTFHYVRKAEMWALEEAINLVHYQSIIRTRLQEIDEGMTAQGDEEYAAAEAAAAAAAAAAAPAAPAAAAAPAPAAAEAADAAPASPAAAPEEEAAPALMRVD